MRFTVPVPYSVISQKLQETHHNFTQRFFKSGFRQVFKRQKCTLHLLCSLFLARSWIEANLKDLICAWHSHPVTLQSNESLHEPHFWFQRRPKTIIHRQHTNIQEIMINHLRKNGSSWKKNQELGYSSLK